MVGERFDALAKLAAFRSRRGALRLLIGGTLGVLAGGRWRSGAAICPECCIDTPCKSCAHDPVTGVCNCEEITGPCTESVQAANPCLEGPGTCQQGFCVYPNKPALTPCDGGACVNGNCCPSSFEVCLSDGGRCVNTQNDPLNCGTCDNRCAGAEEWCCGGACTDIRTDLNNCGLCGIACGDGESCCQIDASLSAACRTLGSDKRNCGQCGHRCKKGKRCRHGRCR